MADKIEKPKSYNDFLESIGIKHIPEAFTVFSVVIAGYPESFEKPGSYRDSLALRGIEHSPEAFSDYSVVIAGYREALMAHHDLSQDDLHAMRFPVEESSQAA
jgi:hypothetical protein